MKALARLRGCTVAPESSLCAYAHAQSSSFSTLDNYLSVLIVVLVLILRSCLSLCFIQYYNDAHYFQMFKICLVISFSSPRCVQVY